jgi:hypothetical protein
MSILLSRVSLDFTLYSNYVKNLIKKIEVSILYIREDPLILWKNFQKLSLGTPFDIEYKSSIQ